MSDDRVDEAFAALRSAPGGPLPPAAAVRARGEQRRRRARAAVAAGTCAVVAAGAVVWAAAARVPDEAPFVDESPAPSVTVTPSVTPTVTPSSSSPPSSSPPVPAPASYGVLAAALLDPADLRSPGDTRWTEREEGREIRETTMDPCGDTRYPAEAARVRGVWRDLYMSEPNGEPVSEGPGLEHDVAAYPDEASAAAAEQGYRDAVRRCRSHEDGGLRVTYTVMQQQPLIVRRTYTDLAGQNMAHYPTYVAVVRHADVVALVTMSFGEGPDDEGAREVTAAALTELRAAR